MIPLLIVLLLLASNRVIGLGGVEATLPNLIMLVLVLTVLLQVPKQGRAWKERFLSLPINFRWGIGLLIFGSIVGQVVSDNRFSAVGTILGLLITPLTLAVVVFLLEVRRKDVVVGVLGYILVQNILFFTKPDLPLQYMGMTLLLGAAIYLSQKDVPQLARRLLIGSAVLFGIVVAMYQPAGVVRGPELTHSLQYYPLAGQGMNRLPLSYERSSFISLPPATRTPSSFFLYLWLSCGLMGLIGMVLILTEASLPLKVFAALGLLGGIVILPVTWLLFWIMVFLPQYSDKQT